MSEEEEKQDRKEEEEKTNNNTSDNLEDEKTAQLNLPLEWTQLGKSKDEKEPPIRYLEDVTDVNPEEEELILVGTAGMKITNMGPNFSTLLNPNLKQLVLRSHMIHKMEGLQGLKHLELLELYDNQIEVLASLDEGEDGAPGSTIQVLDMSYNVIRDMTPVQVCPNLVDLCK